jgi:protein required for attachment to host cells
MTTWILVSNSSKAFLYETKNIHKEPLARVDTFFHPKSLEKNHDLLTDRPARFIKSGSAHSATDKADPHEHEAEIFATELAKMLEKAHGESKFSRLVIVSLPHFTGLINKHFKSKHAPIVHVEKNYVDLTVDELTERLKEVGA